MSTLKITMYIYVKLKEGVEMDILFQVLLLVHILGAICGLGATFATPFIMKGGNTVTTAKTAHAVNVKVEKLAKMGSLTFLEPD